VAQIEGAIIYELGHHAAELQLGSTIKPLESRDVVSGLIFAGQRTASRLRVPPKCESAGSASRLKNERSEAMSLVA
jgi:hypothetical protein